MELEETKLFRHIDQSLPKFARQIAVKLSGGADSALAAYAIASYISRLKLNIKIIPVVVSIDRNPFQLEVAEGVVEVIEHILNFKFLSIAKFSVESGDKLISKMRSLEKMLLNSGVTDLIVSGATHYPRQNDFVPPEQGGPEENRKGEFPLLWSGPLYTPFVNMDKKDIAFYYREQNLMKNLFPKTRTCNVLIARGIQHCGDCWSCRERQYGFGSL